MCDPIAVRKSTLKSLQVIFAYQGQQLIRKIGKKKGWSDSEVKELIREFINNKELDIQIIPEEVKSSRGNKNLSLSMEEKCRARVANGNQCSRRRKENEQFCGIHLRKSRSDEGLQYGLIDSNRTKKKRKKFLSVDSDSDTNSYASDGDLAEKMREYYPLGDVAEDSDDNDVNVSSIVIEGKEYMIDEKTNLVYSCKTEELLGRYVNGIVIKI